VCPKWRLIKSFHEKAGLCQECFFCSLVLVRHFALSQAASVENPIKSAPGAHVGIRRNANWIVYRVLTSMKTRHERAE